LVFAFGAFAQTGHVFEVAVVKPTGPATSWTTHVGIEGGPGTHDPGRISYAHLTLRTLLWSAYDVTDYQISGPAWLGSERYDIVATVPRDASKEQVAVMLQELLADRFQLVLHREKRDLAVYALIIGNKDSKLKPSQEAAVTDDSSPADAPGSQPPISGARRAKLKQDKYGFSELPAGLRGRTAMERIAGNQRLTAYRLSMERLAVDWLATEMGRPVVDNTGLKGDYDFTLTFRTDKTRPVGSPGGAGNAGRNTPEAPDIFAAIQEQLGLKLESRRLPVDVLVVDMANKVPTDN
jgi:uncharacterized protein (TIGR03435 family)